MRTGPPPLVERPPSALRLAAVEQIEIGIEKLVAGGDGLGRWEGIPLFVPRSAPGDRLRVQITERHRDYGRAEIVEILEGGPGRRPDPYPSLAATGLCDLQHLDDGLQPQLKAQAVRETLEHLGGVKLPEAIEIITGDPWHYRLRTQLHSEIGELGHVCVGYHARGTNRVIPVSECPLLVPELEELLVILPRLLPDEPPKRIDLAAGDEGQVTVAPVIGDLPHGEVTIDVSTAAGDLTYAYDARCFFQGHRGLLPQLIDLAIGPWQGESAFDLYGGVGLFALPLSRRYAHTVAVEGDQVASRFSRINTRRNRIGNLECVSNAVETWVAALPEGASRVIVDPPRGGLHTKVREALLTQKPERLTYVSCHPATLARDLRHLAHGFAIESVVFLDLFPQTGHLEAVVQLVRG